jgi:hypothetical protein
VCTAYGPTRRKDERAGSGSAGDVFGAADATGLRLEWLWGDVRFAFRIEHGTGRYDVHDAASVLADNTARRPNQAL